MPGRNWKVISSPEARRDLRTLLLHSQRRWGAAQRDLYQDALRQTVESLRANPELGRTRDELPPGTRSMSVRQHTIFYDLEDDAIHILRILHVRRDAEDLLNR